MKKLSKKQQEDNDRKVKSRNRKLGQKSKVRQLNTDSEDELQVYPGLKKFKTEAMLISDAKSEKIVSNEIKSFFTTHLVSLRGLEKMNDFVILINCWYNFLDV